MLDAPIVDHPKRSLRVRHLCGDLGCNSDDLRQAVTERLDQIHFGQHRPKVIEIPIDQRHPARRWVVERTLS